MNMVLMTLYVIIAWIVTPFAIEFVNTKTAANNQLINVIKGWPAFMMNVVVCAIVALIITFLPGGWSVTLMSWFLLTTVVYFGNQFFFQSVVKPMMAHRKA